MNTFFYFYYLGIKFQPCAFLALLAYFSIARMPLQETDPPTVLVKEIYDSGTVEDVEAP